MSKGNTLINTGNPKLNGVVDGVLKVGGIGALQAATKETYKLVVREDDTNRRVERAVWHFVHHMLRADEEDLNAVHRMGRETLNWGLAAGLYTGASYGVQQARGGLSDWKNAVAAGAVTGAAITFVNPRPRHEIFVQNVITGGALAMAADILRKLC